MDILWLTFLALSCGIFCYLGWGWTISVHCSEWTQKAAWFHIPAWGRDLHGVQLVPKTKDFPTSHQVLPRNWDARCPSEMDSLAWQRQWELCLRSRIWPRQYVEFYTISFYTQIFLLCSRTKSAFTECLLPNLRMRIRATRHHNSSGWLHLAMALETPDQSNPWRLQTLSRGSISQPKER